LKDMYDLSKFEGYRNFEKFDLVQLRKKGNQAICDELHEIKNPNLKKDILSNVILDSNKFQLKKQYETIFRDIKFYKDMINYFFEQDSISHSEFIKLFVERQVLDHPVKFNCDTNVAASFIYNLQGRFFKKLSIAYLLNNQTFQSFAETKLTGANLSNTKSKDNSQIFPSLSSKLLQHSL